MTERCHRCGLLLTAHGSECAPNFDPSPRQETPEQEVRRIQRKLVEARADLSFSESLRFYATLSGFLACQVDADVLDEGIEQAFRRARSPLPEQRHP